MQFISTRGGIEATAAEAVVRGICPLGGLYVPADFPSAPDFMDCAEDYPALARMIMQPYLGIPEDELLSMTRAAYADTFHARDVVPLTPLGAGVNVLELFHGPTLAFKDIALQMLPYLMRYSVAQTGGDKKVYILVATSGDTGKAALEGFRDVEGTAIQVFYPHGGVSRAQWLQMATQPGKNTFVCGVEGNFDDAQTAVKRIFADEALRHAVADCGYRMTSANSINFGRLLPQIVYYFSAYARLVQRGAITPGKSVNFCVPTGNFGNILAGYYAMRMGLPIHKLICASNRNNVLTDFFHNGVYTSRRPFYKSMSCSIDILVSSNLERLLFEVTDRDTQKVRDWMHTLAHEGGYDAGKETAGRLSEFFYADWCDENDTRRTIKARFESDGYLMDPHTAVGDTILDRYRKKTSDDHPTVLLATAHPFKFASDVLSAFEMPGEDDFKNSERLSAFTGMPIPHAIAELQGKPILHKTVCSVGDMPRRVLAVL